MTDQYTLLINPPLWNAYAPHLAVPLLAGTLKERGLRVRSFDASVELLDWLLSAEGLEALARRRPGTSDRHLAARAELVREHATANVDIAKTVLRDARTLEDPQRQAWARRVLRNATWLISSAFEGLNFDLVANDLYYSATSTEAVIRSLDDPARNIYCWANEHLLPGNLLSDPALGTVGVSVSADTQLIAAMTIAARIKAERPDVKIIFGGNYVTRMVERWTSPHPFGRFVDAFVMAEGEDALPKVIEAFECGESPARIPGVVTMSGGDLLRREAIPVSLDSVSLPDFTDFPLAKYFAPGPILPVYASRSCAWNCAFCSIPFASNSFRNRPAVQVVDHLEELMARHGTNKFMFVDEILTLHVLKEVATEIVGRGLDLRWYGETRFAGGFTPELSRLLYASGCRRLNFGLESYNQRILDKMRKNTKVEHIDRTLEAVLGAGIAPHLFVIHGFPGETTEEAQATVDFAEDIVRRAQEEYGNPYATWGGSPFILDVHSPAAQHPEEFGLTVLSPAAADDLALTRNYTVTEGLDSRKARTLAESARKKIMIRRNVWFRQETESAIAEVEEFTFLRASTRTPNAEPLRSRIWHARSDSLESGVTAASRVFRLPWVADPDGSLGAVAMYEGEADHFVQLTWPQDQDISVFEHGNTARDLATWFANKNVAWADVTGTDLVLLLLRHGFLVPDDGTSVRDEVENVGEWAWCREPGVLAAADQGCLVLHSPVSGNTVRLADMGQMLWELCESGLSLAEIVPDDAPWHSRFTEAVRDLAMLGFIYPHESLLIDRADHVLAGQRKSRVLSGK